jgi:hypothetical protein
MRGASVPYHLRPHKSVDRRLFLDLLTRFERWTPLNGYVYVSMGAYPLEDHKLVHRLIGINQLLAFDFDEEIVARQRFNKPVETCHCVQSTADELIANLEHILVECQFTQPAGIIMWLDYTNPRQIGYQVREFEALLNKLRTGDLVRITVNAHPNAFLDAQIPGGSPLRAAEKMEKQLENLRRWIGEFLPADTSADDMTIERLPQAISRSFAAAALKALPVAGPLTFCPLSVIRYADGQQMLSITGAVVARTDREAMLERLDLETWPFASVEWSIVHQLVVPALTIRERLFLERGVTSKTPEELIAELGFERASDVEIADFLESYKYYYRFYPTLLAADL